MSDLMEDTISKALTELISKPINIPFIACEVADALKAKGYGLLGFSGPSQITAFETPIQPPVLHDCKD